MLDKIKSLSKQTLIYGTSTIVGRFLNFILVPFYTNVFPPAEYGVVAVVFAYIAFLNIVYSFGFEAGYFRFASAKEVGDEKQNFTHPFFLITINSLVISGLILTFHSSIAALIGVKDESIVIYSAFILFFDALALIPFAYLRLKNKAKVFASIKLVNIVVNVTLNLLLILVFKLGLEAVFISNLAASLVTLLLLAPNILKNISFSYHKQLFNELWKFSIPYLPAALASMVVQTLNIIILRFLVDVKTVGIYNANYKLGIFMMLIVSMFEYAWRPFFLNNAKDPNAKALFAKILTLFTGGASVVLIMLTFTIQDIIKIPLPYKGLYYRTRLLERCCYCADSAFCVFVPRYLYQSNSRSIYIEKKTKYLPLITGLGAVLNIASAFLLIPIWGITGGAVSTLISYVAMAVYMYIVSQKFYPVKYEINKLALILLIDIAALAVFFYTFGGLDTVYRIIFAVVLSGGIISIAQLYKVKKLLKSNSK